jgi:hypothetical protein
MSSTIFGAIKIALILFVATWLQACMQPANPYVVGPFPQSHPERQLDLTPMHTVCDSRGENCMACDKDNRNCRKFETPGIIAFATPALN